MDLRHIIEDKSINPTFKSDENALIKLPSEFTLDKQTYSKILYFRFVSGSYRKNIEVIENCLSGKIKSGHSYKNKVELLKRKPLRRCEKKHSNRGEIKKKRKVVTEGIKLPTASTSQDVNFETNDTLTDDMRLTDPILSTLADPEHLFTNLEYTSFPDINLFTEENNFITFDNMSVETISSVQNNETNNLQSTHKGKTIIDYDDICSKQRTAADFLYLDSDDDDDDDDDDE